jgi:hypothetical protein
MTTLSHSSRRKLSLLKLAEELQNVSKACRIMRYHRARSTKSAGLFRPVGSPNSGPKTVEEWGTPQLPCLLSPPEEVSCETTYRLTEERKRTSRRH